MKAKALHSSSFRLLGGLVVLAAIGTLPLWPTLALGSLPNTHEWARYPMLGDMFLLAQQAGVMFPRWLPEMNGGYGYPVFVFYQPSYFFLHSIFASLLDDPAIRQLATTGFLGFLGSAGIFLLARVHLPSWQALIISVIFQLAPNIRFNLTERGDLSEWTVTQIFPFCLYFLHLFLDARGLQRWKSWLGLTLSSSVVLCAHPVALVFLPLLVAAIAIPCIYLRPGFSQGERHRILGEGLLSIGLALALSSPYWFSIAVMKQHSSVDAALVDTFAASSNVKTWSDLMRDGSFFGLPFIGIALAGATLGRSKPFLLSCGMCLLISMVLITDSSQWLWRIRPFSLLLFPWRIAAFAPALIATASIGLLVHSRQDSPHDQRVRLIFSLSAFAIAVVWSIASAPTLEPLELGPGNLDGRLTCLRLMSRIAQPTSYPATLDYGEWLPRTAASGALPAPRGPALHPECAIHLTEIREVVTKHRRMNAFPDFAETPLMTVDHPQWRGHARPEHTDYKLAFDFEGPVEGRITIHQLYFPGWTVAVDGEAVPRTRLERQLLADGRMSIDLPAGQHTIRAEFEGPLFWRERNAAILLCCLLAAFYWIFVASNPSRLRHIEA